MKSLILVLSLSSVFAQAATTLLTGKIIYKGKPERLEALKMASDPVCVKQNDGKPVFPEMIKVNSNGTLANVLVYVKEGAKSLPGENLTPVKLEQKGCHYLPHVVALRVNQPLMIINDDPTMHNVHATAHVNSEFNFGQVSKGQTNEKKFAKPELGIRVKCDVHGWMNASISVFDHPYFAVSDEKGNFEIKDLPPGEYTVEALQEKLGTKLQKVTVTDAGGKKKVDFTFN